MTRTAVFFVASPLHYLAARRVALDHERNSRHVLVCYSRVIEPVVRPGDWDAVVYIPWPRFEPLPGLFGRHRRLLDNLRRVADAIGPVDTLVLHSPVFDTEAINYFLRALPRMTGAAAMQARILPDGLLNVQRYPLSLARRVAQRFRALRRLVSPVLHYWHFSGDRIGSDASFVDRIYVLRGFPHRYDPLRTVTLGPLTDLATPLPTVAATHAREPTRALVVGQPLAGFGLMSEADRVVTSREISDWLASKHPGPVDYKAHPREGDRHELREPRYHLLEIDEPLENYLARTPYAVVVGCCSTALFIARQIYGPAVHVAAFGVNRVHFKGAGKRENTLALMRELSIEVH
ncbi:MAG: hypothetical protein ABS56_15960 [Lautropia sp. SCN 69-89]|nr:MAG: hypothetical protein ABS56_15960 [Lautropia sp. SCN 69-89]